MVWLRNKMDFVLYGIRIGKINPYSFVINLVILIYSMLEYETILHSGSLLVIAFLVFVNIVWQVISTVNEYYSYVRKTKYYFTNESRIMDHYVLDPTIADEYELVADEIGSVIYSRRINAIMTGTMPIRMQLSKRKTVTVDNYIRSHKDILLPFLNYKWHEVNNNDGLFYNEAKLCMASEIALGGDACIVMVNKGSYYDSFLTNNIYNKKMSHQNGFCIQPPFNAMNYPICSLDVSLMNNHIGVSTLAVSEDGYTVLLRHNNRSAMFTDKLQPSGSGSVDYADMKGTSDFRLCITRAAERELREETGIPADTVVVTKVIGFYRDLNRGGKPEFCCLSFLKYNRYDLTEHIRPSKSEQRDDFQLVRLFDQGRLIYKTLSDIEPVIGKECSLSLSMNLFMLCGTGGDHVRG